jgi:hypothetical protein
LILETIPITEVLTLSKDSALSRVYFDIIKIEEIKINKQTILKKTSEKDDVFYFLDNKLHSIDSETPSFFFKCINLKQWHKQGQFHRDNDLPAIITQVSKKWCINGLEHRINNPSFTSEHITTYMKNGVLHNKKGAAFIKEVIKNKFQKKYYVEGKEYQKEEFDKIIKLIKNINNI